MKSKLRSKKQASFNKSSEMVAFNVLMSPDSYDVSGDRVGGDADQ